MMSRPTTHSDAVLQLKRSFIEFALACEVLRFGAFTLKSGRSSPYFFNSGLFRTGAQLARLGRYYAQSIDLYRIEADVLFGPAYKGIPLVNVTAVALAEQYGKDWGVAFNRKEAKSHGEGGMLVGSPLRGKVLILDDVVTAGTSIGESVEIIRGAGAEVCGVLIALDRQEIGPDGNAATTDVHRQFGIPVYSIVTMEDLMEYLLESGELASHWEAMRQHRTRYGAG